MLCEECRDDLASPIRTTPEQIQLRVGDKPTAAALVDLWGRPHTLEPTVLVGRQIDGPGLALLEPSVSRRHAELKFANGAWTVRDFASANGTYVADQLVENEVETVVKPRDRLRFGHIAFYLVSDIALLPPPRIGRTATRTIRPPGKDDPAPAPPPPNDFADEEERTGVGLPIMAFQLHEPTGGGGGVIDVEGKQVQLTTTQFELMALMIRRMAGEVHQPELVRGFVRSSELIADLSWDTREPSENHVKQLVRRVRRALLKADMGDLIESRHRFGYRLRAIPKPDRIG